MPLKLLKMRFALHITSFQGKNYNKRFILLKKSLLDFTRYSRRNINIPSR